MFHVVPAHLQPQAHPMMSTMNISQTTTTTDATMYRGFPVHTQDGRAMMYMMPTHAGAPPTPSPTTPTQPTWSMATGGSMLSAAVGPTPDHLTAPTWATTQSSLSGSPQQTPLMASDLRRSPPLPDGPPPYANEKSTASGMSTSSLLRPTAAAAAAAAATSISGMSTTLFEASTASTISAYPSASASTTTYLPFLRTAPTPQLQSQSQAQAQTCFWVDSATGAMKAMTAEEMHNVMATAALSSRTPATAAIPTYAGASQPLPRATDSLTSAAAYSMVPPNSFNASMGSVFSASLSGGVSYLPVVAMAPLPPPPPPAAAKAMNGLQYEHGELYEGYVKRYNPNRGFGFLTATHHVRPESASSANGSPAASVTTVATASTTTTAAKERRVPVHLGDIFVHQSYMHMQGFRTLPVGGRVRFRVGYKDGQQTFQAVDVELLPQVIPQSMEASATTATMMMAAPADGMSMPSPNASMPQHPAATMASTTTTTVADFDRAVGPAVGSSGRSHSEAENFFFPGCVKAGQVRSPVTLTQGESMDGEDENDSPLIELAYEVYTSLED